MHSLRSDNRTVSSSLEERLYRQNFHPGHTEKIASDNTVHGNRMRNITFRHKTGRFIFTKSVLVSGNVFHLNYNNVINPKI